MSERRAGCPRKHPAGVGGLPSAFTVYAGRHNRVFEFCVRLSLSAGGPPGNTRALPMFTLPVSSPMLRLRTRLVDVVAGYDRAQSWLSRPAAVAANLCLAAGVLLFLLGSDGWTFRELAYMAALTFEGVAALPGYAQAGLAAATMSLVAMIAYARRNPGWADHISPARAALAYLGLNVADILTTFGAITWLGASEQNGVMAAAIAGSWWVFVAVKMLVASLLAAVFWLSTRSRWLMVSALTITSIVVLNNAIVIARELLYPCVGC